MDVTETPEYQAGWEWATEHMPVLTELFTRRDAVTPELRKRLFEHASRLWPSSHDDLSNDLKQTAFVVGAMKAVVQSSPSSRETSIALMEAALDMGVLWSTEQGKAEAFDQLKAKPAGWWRAKMGNASPNDVVGALSVAWRHDWSKERGRKHPRSKWEVLIDTLGTREMWVLAEATSITEHESGPFLYLVESPENSFEMISRPQYEGSRMLRYPGEIVG